MATFSDLLDRAFVASESLNAIEDTSNARVLSFFGRFDNGLMQYGELRIELIRQVNTSFVTSGAIAVEHMNNLISEAGLPRVAYSPAQTSPALEKVHADLVRNLEEFRDSERTEKDFRRLRFRARLGVQHAVRRGFTDNQLAYAEILTERGASLRKLWMANFVNNEPCTTCASLHGTEVDIHDEFSHGSDRAPKVYMGLQGPPRHPNCRCYLMVYVVTLGTVSTPAPASYSPQNSTERTMTAREVRRLPKAAFIAVVTTLRLIAGKLKEALRGKR